MCDFSLQAAKSRPAKVADKLVTHNFGMGTRGFADPAELDVAVCVMPGTEIAFDAPIKKFTGWYDNDVPPIKGEHSVAIFRQVEKETAHTHHDCLELPDGQRVLLTQLQEGQHATVLQLPAAPKNDAEAKEQERAVFAG